MDFFEDENLRQSLLDSGLDIDTFAYISEVTISSMASNPTFISAGLEPNLGHTEKSCIASYYTQLSTTIKRIIKLIPVLLDKAPAPLGLTNLAFIFLSRESYSSMASNPFNIRCIRTDSFAIRNIMHCKEFRKNKTR